MLYIMNTYSVSQFARRIGVTIHTLQRWDREGRLRALRTPTNRRLYTDDHLAQVLHVRRGDMQRRTVVYMRVSSNAQKPDLAKQRTALESFCAARGLAIDEWIEEIGGGLNLKRPKFVALVDRIISGEIATIVIAHKDRLARFGVELIQHLCDVHGTALLVLNAETLSPEREMVQDLLAIVHCFSARLYGLRNHRKALKKVLSDAARAQNPAQSDT
jgi:predicted site-specific integrase-resolvase